MSTLDHRLKILVTGATIINESADLLTGALPPVGTGTHYGQRDEECNALIGHICKNITQEVSTHE